jgi:hypothetical protein
MTINRILGGCLLAAHTGRTTTPTPIIASNDARVSRTAHQRHGCQALFLDASDEPFCSAPLPFTTAGILFGGIP